jgi:cell wall-associated NlpC family hydrolase
VVVRDIIFYTYPGETVPHHVVIYLGGDRILEAPQTGENVRYGTLSEFPGRRRRYSVGESP